MIDFKFVELVWLLDVFTFANPSTGLGYSEPLSIFVAKFFKKRHPLPRSAKGEVFLSEPFDGFGLQRAP